MSYNNQLRLKVNVREFVKQIWQSENLVSYDMALAAQRFCTLQGRHGVQISEMRSLIKTGLEKDGRLSGSEGKAQLLRDSKVQDKHDIVTPCLPRSVGNHRAARATSWKTKVSDYHIYVTNSLTFTLSLSWLLQLIWFQSYENKRLEIKIGNGTKSRFRRNNFVRETLTRSTSTGDITGLD